MTKKISFKDQISLYLYCLILSFIFLLICTKSSPLYPTNDWVDSNAFFTMGKGMINGKVLYRDLFEQKGPYLYLIHGFAYLISNTSFIGVFIFEVLSFSFFIFFAHKLITLYLPAKYSIISLPLIAVIVLNMRNFMNGDSAEEFCIPLLTISLYHLINYFKNEYPNPASNKCLFLNGIIAGFVLWTKFTLLGFWFGWMASLFLCMIYNKFYLHAVKACMIFLFGMFVTTIPWIIYFGVNNAIVTWLYVYVFVNMNGYSVSSTFINRFLYVIYSILSNLAINQIFGIVSIYGILSFLIFKKYLHSRFNRLCLAITLVFFALGVYAGGRGYIYYFLIFSPLLILGFIVIMDLFILNLDKLITQKLLVYIVITSVIITLPLTFAFNHNTYFMKVNKNDLAQYKFAIIINQVKDATLLNYGHLDYGVYTAANTTPNVRFFENQNIEYSKFPLIMDEQNRYIKEKMVDFVVIGQEASQKATSLNVPYLQQNYDLVMIVNQMFEYKKYNFFLYKVK